MARRAHRSERLEGRSGEGRAAVRAAAPALERCIATDVLGPACLHMCYD